MYKPKLKSKNPICAYLSLSAALQQGLCHQGAGKWQFFADDIFKQTRSKGSFSGVWDFVLRNLNYRYFRKSGLALEIMADNVFMRCPLNLC